MQLPKNYWILSPVLKHWQKYDNGIAPVFASSVTYKDGKWEIDRTFDVAGAMHAANKMIWLHHDEVDGFPTL